jgi:hypothetical protein
LLGLGALLVIVIVAGSVPILLRLEVTVIACVPPTTILGKLLGDTVYVLYEFCPEIAIFDTANAALPLLVIVNVEVDSTLTVRSVATSDEVDTVIPGKDAVPVTVAVMVFVPAVPQSIEITGALDDGTANPVNLT